MTERLRKLSAVVAVAAIVSCVAAVAAEESDTEGAEVGKWTQDADAAMKLAANTSLPLLLNFTGSDWCGWCKLMVREVFDKEDWQTYAGKNVVLVTIDFPRDKSLVPEKYVARNRELAAKFGVQGYPTYVVLDSDGETELGRLGADRDSTPAAFIKDFEGILRYRPVAMATFADGLSGDRAEAYRTAAAALTAARADLKALSGDEEEAREKAEKAIDNVRKQIDAIHVDVHADKLGPVKGKEYKELIKQLAEAEGELQVWLETRPQRTPENTKKFQGFNTKIGELKTQISGM